MLASVGPFRLDLDRLGATQTECSLKPQRHGGVEVRYAAEFCACQLPRLADVGDVLTVGNTVEGVVARDLVGAGRRHVAAAGTEDFALDVAVGALREQLHAIGERVADIGEEVVALARRRQGKELVERQDRVPATALEEARAAVDARLAALDKRGQQVNDLQAGLERLDDRASLIRLFMENNGFEIELFQTPSC